MAHDSTPIPGGTVSRTGWARGGGLDRHLTVPGARLDTQQAINGGWHVRSRPGLVPEAQGGPGPTYVSPSQRTPSPPNIVGVQDVKSDIAAQVAAGFAGIGAATLLKLAIVGGLVIGATIMVARKAG